MTLEEISAEAAPETVVTTETTEENPAEAEPKQETIESTDEDVTPDPIDIVKNLPPRKKTAAERIAELTWKAKEKEREAEYWREQAKTKPPETQRTQPADRPRLEQFDTQEEYEDALLTWHERKSSERTQVEKQKEREEEAVRQFNGKSAKLREIHEDFDEVIQAPVFTKTMRSVLLTSDQGPVMAYYLGRPENIQVAERIASLPPELQPYEIGKLETQLLLAQKTKKVTSAPAPITPVGGVATTPIDEDSLSDEEWFALEQKKRMERIKQRTSGG